jgi:hypothetical protein
MRELLEWAIAGYMSNPNAGDDDVAQLLGGAFPPALATRAVLAVRLAFGRRILREMVPLPDTFVGTHGEAPLASEPLYAAAEALAAEAGREAIQRIGLGSAEVLAINDALNAGAKPGDLVVAPPHLALGGPIDGAGGDRSAAAIVGALLEAHGGRLACEARLYPGTLRAGYAQGQLDVVVSAPVLGQRRMIESFAAAADTIRGAWASAAEKFERGSLHVALAALDEARHGEGQVEWEEWGGFRACLGPLMQLWSDPPAVDFGAFLGEIRRRLLAAPLSREIHWFRTFVAVGPEGVIGHDALLDNETWAPGVDAVTSWSWPAAPMPYALRHLLVLVPAGGETSPAP